MDGMVSWSCAYCSCSFTLSKDAARPSICPNCHWMAMPTWIWGILAVLSCNLLHLP
jgi:hypothetical protein